MQQNKLTERRLPFPGFDQVAFLFFLHLLTACLSIPQKTLVSAPVGYIGEIGTTHLRDNGFFISPMTNDVLGRTDKLMTSSSSLQIKLPTMIGDSFASSFNSAIYWRALAPSFREKDGAPEFAEPLGFYADWLEGQASLAFTHFSSFGGLQIYGGGGLGEIADHGMEGLHRSVHKAINQPYKEVRYTNSEKRATQTTDFGVALLMPRLTLINPSIEGLLSLGQTTNLFFQESYGRLLLIYDQSPDFGFSMERRVIAVHSARRYEEVRPYRYESALVLRLGKGFFPGIKTVSPYLKKDKVGQIYVDLLNWNFVF